MNYYSFPFIPPLFTTCGRLRQLSFILAPRLRTFPTEYMSIFDVPRWPLATYLQLGTPITEIVVGLTRAAMLAQHFSQLTAMSTAVSHLSLGSNNFAPRLMGNFGTSICLAIHHPDMESCAKSTTRSNINSAVKKDLDKVSLPLGEEGQRIV